MLSPQFKPIRFVVYSLLQFILGFIACFMDIASNIKITFTNGYINLFHRL